MDQINKNHEINLAKIKSNDEKMRLDNINKINEINNKHILDLKNADLESQKEKNRYDAEMKQIEDKRIDDQHRHDERM